MIQSLFNHFENIFVFDVETTGLYPGRDEIIEIAMLHIANHDNVPKIINDINTLIRLSPGKELPSKITELTGITMREINEKGKTKEEVCDKLSVMLNCDNPLIAAYNAQFDLGFLYYLLNQYNQLHLLQNLKMLDVLTIYKDRKPYPHKLSDAATAYNIDAQQTHRAYGDALLTYKVLCEMGKELDDFEHYVNLFGYNPKYGISGKKISSIKYLPQGFNRTTKLYNDIH